MRKTFIGLLIAATALSPAMADKGGKKGGGGGPKHHFAGPGGGNGGGGKHGFKPHKADRGGPAMAVRGPGRDDWYRPVRYERPVRYVQRDRFDDKQARKAWKREAKEERKFARAVERRERFVPVERWAPAPRRESYYRVARYAAPVAGYAAWQGYAQPQQAWPVGATYPVAYAQPTAIYDDGYAPYYDDRASGGGGLFGGQGGVLGALLPMVISSLFGGGDLGGLGGVGGLTGLAGAGTLGALGGVDVLPLQQAGYVDPYASGTDDLTSSLLPALLSNAGGLF